MNLIFHATDEQAKQLTDLAVEHTALAARAGQRDCTEIEKAYILHRVKVIRKERDSILEAIKKRRERLHRQVERSLPVLTHRGQLFTL